MADLKTYTFKPMAGLTRWALILIAIKILCVAAFASGITVCMLIYPGQEEGIAAGLTGMAALLYIVLLIVSGIVSLIWVYGAMRNARALRPTGITNTPAWAVGWFFVPLANLYKPIEVMQEIWVASRGPLPERGYQKPSSLIIWWWCLNIVGNAITTIAGKMDGSSEGLSYKLTGPNIASVFGLMLFVISTALFFRLVQQIYRYQLANDIRVVDQF